MDFKIKEKGDIRIIGIKGRLDNQNSGQLENLIKELLDQGISKIIIDLAGTNYISSSGLRVLLLAQQNTLILNGKIIFCHPQKRLNEILDATGECNLLSVVQTEKEALTAITA